MGMVQKHAGQIYDWSHKIGHDDYGDCLAMCRVAAAYGGIGTGGQVAQRSRRARVVINGKSYGQQDKAATAAESADENEQQPKQTPAATSATTKRARAIIGRRSWS
jgi:hypothetical protein